MNSKYSALQDQVIDRAREILKKEHNINKVCLDQLAKDDDIERDGIEECAMTLVIDTCYWEGSWP